MNKPVNDPSFLFRAGIFSDVQAIASTHNAEIFNFGLALDLFLAQGVDLLLNAGDFAEGADPKTFELYWKLIEERFGRDGVAHFACEGNHECTLLPKGEGLQGSSVWRQICEGYRRGTENPYVQEYRGLPFVAFSTGDGWHYREEDLLKLDAVLSGLEEKHPGKPVFLVTHFAPADTVVGSDDPAASRGLRKVLDRHPQTVSFSGHMHIPLEDERNLWQGAFTAVATGTLAYGCFPYSLFNCCGIILPFARECIQGMVMDVFSDRLQIRRYNVLSGKELSPECRWSIPLPHWPEHPVFTDERGVSRTAPEFPGNALLLTRYDYGYVFLLFPRPDRGDIAQFYDVEIAERYPDGTFAEPSMIRFAGDFYRLEEHRHDLQELRLPGKGMKPGTDYRIRVYPVECFGKRGKPLEILEHTWPGYVFKDGTPQYPQE